MNKNKAQTQRETGNPYNLIKPSLLALAITQALAFQVAHAANIEVTSNLDDGTDCTLREALATVNAGAGQLNGCVIAGDPLGTDDTITFGPTVSGQTITTALGELPITKDVSINSGGAPTTIDANGVGRVMRVGPNSTVELDQLTLTGGNAPGGGGIFAYTNSSVTLTNSTVSGNSGGGIFAADDTSVMLTNSTVSGNTGGGIYAYTSGVTLSNSTVSGNSTSISGGGIDAVYRSSVTLTNSTVSGNTAGNRGGGIGANDRSSVTLTNSTVSSNTAGSDGGGISSHLYSDVTLTNSTVSGNSAESGGGGIDTDFSDVSLMNSTVSDNKGGGIDFGVNLSDAAIENSTVSGNTGYGISGYGLTLTNSTVSGNTDGGISVEEVRGLVNSIIANNGLPDCSISYFPVGIGVGADTISTTACDGATIADPLLGPLADNGGPTQTHALLAGSPAIDNGTGSGATATDQRGVAAEGVRDSGAYEFTAAMNALAIEKLINHRVRETPDTAAQLLVGTRYRAEYKVTNNSPNRLYNVEVFEGGELVCNVYPLDPGESRQRYRCASSQDVLPGLNNVPAAVTAKVSGSNQELTNQSNAYYTGFGNVPGKLKVTHYVNNKNADTGASAVTVNGNQAEIVFRVENTGSIKLYRVNTFHDPVSPVNSGWQQQCFFGTLDPGQVRYCKRTISVTQAGLNKAFGRAQGQDANVSPIGFVNASNPTYFNVVLP